MKKLFGFTALYLIDDQRGQILPWAAFAMVGLLGLCGLTVDVGRAYVARAQLQADANAAALAAAPYIYDTSPSATSIANQYSASSGDLNANSSLGTVTTTATPKCLNMLLSGVTCATNPAANAIQVTETAAVPTYFMRVFGWTHVNVSATAVASSGNAQPWNIAFIMDATGSMSNSDTNCGGISEYQCALNGLQAFLSQGNGACPAGVGNCPSDGVGVHVALFTFPNIITNDLGWANACSGASYTEPAPYQVHTLPVPGQTGYTPLTYIDKNGTKWSASYEVTYGAGDADANGFVNDWYSPSSTSTGKLNPNSSLVQAVGYPGKGPCMADSPGGIALNGATGTPKNNIVNTGDVGEGITYYASAIYAAQSALAAEQIKYPKSNNAIVLLSDGQANTQWIYFPQGELSAGDTANPATIEPSESTIGYSALNTAPWTGALVASKYTSPTSETKATISGLYPDFFDECQQAIKAAQDAADAGTRVYAIAYGSETTGCGSGNNAADYTDVTLVQTGRNVGFTTTSQITPCVTMENIASSLEYFFSDFNQSGSGRDVNCQDKLHDITNLNAIFNAVWTSLSGPRLLPNNAT